MVRAKRKATLTDEEYVKKRVGPSNYEKFMNFSSAVLTRALLTVVTVGSGHYVKRKIDQKFFPRSVPSRRYSMGDVNMNDAFV